MVNHWRIVRRISGGSYGVVYEVENDGRRFALKLACQLERGSDPLKTDARAQREVACLQQLRHPHIIRMWSYGRWPDPCAGFLYIILDFVDGYTLAQWSTRTHPTPHEIVVLFLKLFDAVDYMHRHNVFHRDLSVLNIMVTKQGEPVIIDFGTADYATADELTDGPLPPGTPRNRSPEAQRFWGENRLNPRARYTFRATDDIFALGAVLYDVLTDPTPELPKERPPLNDEVMAPPSPFRVTQGRVPAELSAYVMLLLRRDPEQRPAVAKDGRRPLEEFVGRQGPEWRATPVHPVAEQLPPEPGDLAPGLAETREVRGPKVPIPFHPPAAPGQPPPEEVAPMPAAPGAAALPRRRQAWRPGVAAGTVMLAVLGAAVAVLLLTRAFPWEPPPPALGPPVAQPPAALAEKPTSRPAGLPSADPTQQEAIPSVQQPKPSPSLTDGIPSESQLRRSKLAKLRKCALLVGTLEWVHAGCAGLQPRPEPKDCAEETVKVMEEELGWRMGGGIEGDHGLLRVTVDVTKGALNQRAPVEDRVANFQEGPVTGILEIPVGNVPAGTRLDGHLWTTGDRIYGRYFFAHLPGGRKVPICVQLMHANDVGMDKVQGLKPGPAVGRKTSDAWAVERWD
jgi:serine/threonine-protein kinase